MAHFRHPRTPEISSVAYYQPSQNLPQGDFPVRSRKRSQPNCKIVAPALIHSLSVKSEKSVVKLPLPSSLYVRCVLCGDAAPLPYFSESCAVIPTIVGAAEVSKLFSLIREISLVRFGSKVNSRIWPSATRSETYREPGTSIRFA